MLYLNTRSKIDTYTANYILKQELPAKTGLALPLNIPTFDDVQLHKILVMPFAETVSYVLNIFFPGRVTAWDVSCALGKNPVRADSIGQKVIVGALWDNRQHSGEHLIHSLYGKLCGTDDEVLPTGWARVAITVSLMFGVFTEIKKQNINQVDFAAASGDFETVFAAWYARKMGLPFGTILCICNENSSCWDFLHRGSLNAGAQTVQTALPEMDVQLPKYLEALLYCTLGREYALGYAKASENAESFTLGEEQLACVNEGMYACVVGSSRVDDVISSVNKTDGYALDIYAAAVYGGLQDYRAKTGKNCHTLVWAKHSP